MATPNALATLLKLQSPSNMNSTGDPYVDRRRSDIVSGMDEYAPSELDQRMVQSQLGDQGMGVSRDMIRESGIQQGVQGARAQQEKLRQLLLPAQIKGEYDVRAAQEASKAQADRLRYSNEQQNARTDKQIAAVGGRQDVGIDAAAAAAKAVADAKATRVNPASLTNISSQRAKLAADITKSNPNALMSALGRKNPRAAELEAFDNSLGYAQKIMDEMPDASAEEALMQMGEQPTPDELGQIQNFLLLLRGH